MKMEVLAAQQQFQTQYGVLGSNKVKDWTSTLTTLTPPSSPTIPMLTPLNAQPITADTPMAKNKSNANNGPSSQLTRQMQSATSAAAGRLPPYLQNDTTNKIKNSISKKNAINNHHHHHHSSSSSSSNSNSSSNKLGNKRNTVYESNYHANNSSNSNSNSSNNSNTNNTNNSLLYCDNLDAAAVSELSLRLLDELRAAKSRHLTCTEVQLPCDLTPRIAAEILRVSSKEPCGIRGCTIYIEFEDEPNNSRRIATLKLDADTVSTFEVYLTLRQDHRGWASLLPQFMKSLARTITISQEFTITKHKLYSPQLSSSYSYGSSSSSSINTNGSNSMRNNGGGNSYSNRPSAAISTPSS